MWLLVSHQLLLGYALDYFWQALTQCISGTIFCIEHPLHNCYDRHIDSSFIDYTDHLIKI